MLNRITSFYTYVNDDLADPRTKDWWLVSSPFPVAALLFLYYNFVLKWGPRFMEKRKPLNVTILMRLYNIIQVLVCAYMTKEAFFKLYLSGVYSIWCEKMSRENTPLEQEITSKIYLFFCVKILDLSDTIFFVLRKKRNQVTFLHMYHHMAMCVCGYGGVKYMPGGHGIMLGFLNSVVHVFMYSYYFISSFRKDIPWKKYITQLQIIQFVLVIFHFGHVLFDSSCEYDNWACIAVIPHYILIMGLFIDFYKKNFINKHKSS